MKILRLASRLLACWSLLACFARAQEPIQALPDDPSATDQDRKFMNRAYEVARAALTHGNTPYGALLVGKDGKILMEFENCSTTSGDITKHAETGLVSAMTPKFDKATIASSTFYTSTEPCIMCCGAIRFAGVLKMVYGTTGLQGQKLRGQLIPTLPLQVREVFARGTTPIIVIGPLMEAEGLKIHAEGVQATRKSAQK